MSGEMLLRHEQSALIDLFLSDQKNKLDWKLKRMECLSPTKSGRESADILNKAEKLLKKNVHDTVEHENILEYCALSLAKAPPQSPELINAYNLRSKYLLHIGKYHSCIEDINRILRIPVTDLLKVELHCRIAECSMVTNMGIEEAALAEAEACLEQIPADTLESQRAETILSRTKNRLKDLVVDCSYNKAEAKIPVRPDTSAVTVEYTKSREKRLVATRDLKPGDVVVAEPMYVTVKSHEREIHKVCWHCLSSSWSMVPCQFCDQVFFCSEECCQNAIRQYHDIECPVLNALKIFKEGPDECLLMALKMTIKAFKEAHCDIHNLKVFLNDADRIEDDADVDREKDEEKSGITDNSILSFFGLNSNRSFVPNNALVKSCGLILITLVKFTNIWKGPNAPPINSCQDLLANADFVFLGALLLKLATITNSYSKRYIDPTSTIHSTKDNSFELSRPSELVRGRFISAYGSLLKHSCNPNVYNLGTVDTHVVYYCCLPIPKGAEIFDCFYLPFYSTQPKIKRRQEFFNIYHTWCNCEACFESWGPARPNHNLLEYISIRPSKFSHIDVVHKIMKNLPYYSNTLNDNDINGMLKLKELIKIDIEKVYQNFPFPNPPIIALLYILRITFERCHGCAILKTPQCNVRLSKSNVEVDEVKVLEDEEIDQNHIMANRKRESNVNIHKIEQDSDSADDITTKYIRNIQFKKNKKIKFSAK